MDGIFLEIEVLGKIRSVLLQSRLEFPGTNRRLKSASDVMAPCRRSTYTAVT